MSRPAAKFVRKRTTECPTCGQPKGSPCVRVNYNADAEVDRGPHVSPHAARLRLEEEKRKQDGIHKRTPAEIAEQREASRALRSLLDTKEDSR